MLNSQLLLLSGEGGAKKKRRSGNTLPPLIHSSRNWASLGIWSLLLIQFSCPEGNPKIVFPLRRWVCPLHSPWLFMVEIHPRPRGQSGSAADCPLPQKWPISVSFKVYFDCKQVCWSVTLSVNLAFVHCGLMSNPPRTFILQSFVFNCWLHQKERNLFLY